MLRRPLLLFIRIGLRFVAEDSVVAAAVLFSVSMSESLDPNGVPMTQVDIWADRVDYRWGMSSEKDGGQGALEHVEAAYVEGKVAWPGVDLSSQRFRARVTELVVGQDGLMRWGTDFYLASAAVDGRAVAIAIIDERFVSRLAGRIRRLGSTQADTSDVLQTIRERLFVGERARMRAYNCCGPLEQWIKVVAIRTAIDRHRVEAPVRGFLRELPHELAAVTPDPVTMLVKAQYKAEFEKVLQGQISRLSSRDRTVLRLHLLENVSIDAIAHTRGVHRVTVARWIWNAGEILLDGVRRYFKDRYGIVPSECESLAHLLQSQLSLDLPRLLAVD